MTPSVSPPATTRQSICGSFVTCKAFRITINGKASTIANDRFKSAYIIADIFNGSPSSYVVTPTSPPPAIPVMQPPQVTLPNHV